jgi:hypothetical protein
MLQAQLDECRWVYNELLEQRKLAYEDLGISLSKYQQTMLLPLLKYEIAERFLYPFILKQETPPLRAGYFQKTGGEGFESPPQPINPGP